jgi:hypothetical protein
VFEWARSNGAPDCGTWKVCRVRCGKSYD